MLLYVVFILQANRFTKTYIRNAKNCDFYLTTTESFIYPKIQNMKQVFFLLAGATLLVSCGASKKLKSAESQINTLNGQVTSLNTQVADYTKQVEQLKTENVQYSREAEDCRKIKENLTNKLKKLNDELAAQGTSMKQIIEKVDQSLTKFEDAGADVRIIDGMVHINFPDDFFFKSGSSTIGVRGRESLNIVAEVLREHPGVTLTVEGNTDSNTIPGKADNWSLSTERANAVIRILHDTYNINPLRLRSAGRGKYNPVADNATAEGREKNRRIELIMNPNTSRLWELLDK
jgi:chemotaxis protein MotB